MDCPTNTCFIPSPSTTTSINTFPATLPVRACGAAFSLCMATHDRLLHSVIGLSIIVGILFALSLVLLFLLCTRLRQGREGPILVENGTGTTETPLGTGDVAKHEEAKVPPSPLEPGSPSSSKSQFEVEDAIHESQVLSRVSSVASVHAFSEEHQQQCPCVQPGILAPCSSDHRSSASSASAASIVVSVDDFDQGQDVEFHPEVRTLVEEGKFTKEAVRHMKPVVPKAGTVIPDYNPVLDDARPEKIDEYLRDYRIFFVIDDSGSMSSHWSETRDALSEIANYALTYHSDAIDMRFFNSQYRDRGVRGMNEVMRIFRSVRPSGGTPTGGVLKEVLDEQLNRLDHAQRNGTYSSERPLDIIVLTDGVPNYNSPPAPVIEAAAKRLKDTGHHQNWVGIQFVQIGDDQMAEPTLLSLIDCANNNHMVDTISYSFYKDEGGGKLTSQILERIILGGLHPNLRSYYNQFRHKINQKTSQVIY